MADEDELAYLQPGFELSSLTVPRLRNILVQQGIPFASSAKKAQLIETIEANLLPKAKKLLRERDRVRRTSKGITNVATEGDADADADAHAVGGDGADDERERELMPPPKTPRSRKSKSNLAEETQTKTPATSRRSRTPGARKTTSSRTRRPDPEPETQPEPQAVTAAAAAAAASTKKTRKSLPAASTSSTLQVEESQNIKREPTSSPFSDDNPFQSGSPPSESRRVSSGSRLRKSTGRPSSGKGGETKPTRSTKALPVKQEDEDATNVNSFLPVSHLQTDEHGVTTTEEFTPSAKQELDAELPTRSAPAASAALVRRRKKPASTVSKTWPATLLAITSVAVGAWYRQEKIHIGYCEVGQPQWSLAENEHIPAWVHENLQPACEPCPPHAICYPEMEVRCESDFILKPHPLSLYGLIPLPPTCEPDSEKEKRIKAVADRATEVLRDRRAAYECGEELTSEVIAPPASAASAAASSSSGTTASTTSTTAVAARQGKADPQIAEEQLREQVSKLRRKDMGEDEFEGLWQSALGDVKSRDEVEVTQDERGQTFLSSTSLAKVGVACSIRRGFWRLVAAYRFALIILVLASGGAAWARHEIRSRLQTREQARELAEKVFDRLATQAALQEAGRASEAFLSVRGLRDDILRHVIKVRERQGVWDHVKTIVEGNSNVRAADRESERTGEVSRVWEWTGPVPVPIDLDSAYSARLSGGSGRLSLGGAGHSTGLPIQESPLQSHAFTQAQSHSQSRSQQQQQDAISIRKWDEARPVY